MVTRREGKTPPFTVQENAIAGTMYNVYYMRINRRFSSESGLHNYSCIYVYTFMYLYTCIILYIFSVHYHGNHVFYVQIILQQISSLAIQLKSKFSNMQ